MENSERELYNKLIEMYEEKITRLESENKELERRLLYQSFFPKKGDYHYFPWQKEMNDFPQNPYWGITDPNTGKPIGPQYTPEWVYNPSTTGTPPADGWNTITHPISTENVKYTTTIYPNTKEQIDFQDLIGEK